MMAGNNGSKMVKAVGYIRDVCEEVIAASKALEKRFKDKLPSQYVVKEYWTWPIQYPGSEFFEALGCWFDLYTRRNAFFGTAVYLFDLGGPDTYATLKNEPLVLVGWTGSTKDSNCYDVEYLKSVLEIHVPFGSRLLCWKEGEDGKPLYASRDQSWVYAVPLLRIKTEDQPLFPESG